MKFTGQAFGKRRCIVGKMTNKLEATAGQILKVLSVLLSVNLVVWMACKSWTLVMELTTHIWPRGQRSSGRGRYCAAGAGPTMPHTSEMRGKISGCRL